MKKIKLRWLAVLAVALAMGFTSCGGDSGTGPGGDDDGGGGGNGSGEVSVKITNLTGMGAMLLLPTKPVQWQGLDENTSKAWGTIMTTMKPATTLYGGIAPASQPYAGGSGYLYVEMTTGAPQATFISKNSVTLNTGTNTFNLDTHFDVLHRFNGPGTLTITGMPTGVSKILTCLVYNNLAEPSEITCIASAQEVEYGVPAYDFEAIPLGVKNGNNTRYTENSGGRLVIVSLDFEGDPAPPQFVNGEGETLYDWQSGPITFANGRATIPWSSFVPVPSDL